MTENAPQEPPAGHSEDAVEAQQPLETIVVLPAGESPHEETTVIVGTPEAPQQPTQIVQAAADVPLKATVLVSKVDDPSQPSLEVAPPETSGQATAIVAAPDAAGTLHAKSGEGVAAYDQTTILMAPADDTPASGIRAKVAKALNPVPPASGSGLKPRVGPPALLLDLPGYSRDPLIGARVGEYEVKSLLGKGGFGKVYLGEDIGLGRKAALKFLASIVDDAGLEMFDREAKSLASVSRHPNIVEIYSYGNCNGAPYFALEFVPDSAEARTRRSAAGLAVAEAVRITAECAEALHYAHEQGMLHRDIKPDNILIDPEDDRAKLADFGLAKFVAAEESVTKSIMGTPSFMSPEMLRGEDIDARSDIFALGVTLYELLTKSLPFEGKTAAETINKILEDRRTPIQSFRADVPATIVAVVEKATAHRRDDRYNDAAAFAEDLRNFLKPPVPVTRPRRIVMAGLVAAGVAAGALVAGGVLFSRPVDEPFFPMAAKFGTGDGTAFLEDAAGQTTALEAIAASDLAPPAPPPADVPGFEKYREGYGQMRDNLFASAVEALDEAVRRSPHDRILLNLLDYFPNRELGAAYLSLGRYEEAIAACKRSYETAPSERTLAIIALCVQELARTGNQMDKTEPVLVAQAKREAQFQPRRRRAAEQLVRIQGTVQDDFLIKDFRFQAAQRPALRLLPVTLQDVAGLTQRVLVQSNQPVVRIEVNDFGGRKVVASLEASGESELLQQDFQEKKEPAALSMWRSLSPWLGPNTNVCYAAEVSTPEASQLDGTEIKLASPEDEDVILRDEALLSWSVRSPNILDSVVVDGVEQVNMPARALTGTTWTPLKLGENLIEVTARGKRDPANEPIRASLSVIRKELPASAPAKTYLASPASKPSLVVLAFEGETRDAKGAEVRTTLEKLLESGFEQRFNLHYLDALAPMLSPGQRTRAVATQVDALSVARALPVDLMICGALTEQGNGTEIIAKMLDARTGQLLASAAAFVFAGEPLTQRVEEIGAWLAYALPRLGATVGEVQRLESNRGPVTLFAMNAGAEDGLKAGQQISVFRANAGILRELGRARVVKVGSPYSVCATVSRSTGMGEDEDSLPKPGDMALVR